MALALCCSKALLDVSKEGLGGQAQFSKKKGPMLVYTLYNTFTGDKQQDVLPFHVTACAGGVRAAE